MYFVSPNFQNIGLNAKRHCLWENKRVFSGNIRLNDWISVDIKKITIRQIIFLGCARVRVLIYFACVIMFIQIAPSLLCKWCQNSTQTTQKWGKISSENRKYIYNQPFCHCFIWLIVCHYWYYYKYILDILLHYEQILPRKWAHCAYMCN